MKVGVNTFGLGKWLIKDYEGTLKKLLEAGATSIEPCIQFKENSTVDEETLVQAKKAGVFGGVYPVKEAEDKIRDFRKRGFEVYSIHLFNTVFSVEVMHEVVSFMMQNQLQYAVYSFMESSINSIREKADTIKLVNQLFEKNGLSFLIHNHADEFMEDNGSNVMSYLFKNVPGMKAELDVGWCEYAGEDSVKVLTQYADQIPLIHIKEIAKDTEAGTGKDFCVAPGEGIIPLDAILKQTLKMPLDENKAYIIDQDNSVEGDLTEDIRRGIQNMKQALKLAKAKM